MLSAASRKHAAATCMCVCIMALLTCMPVVHGQCTAERAAAAEQEDVLPADAEVADEDCVANDRCSSASVIDIEETRNCTKCCVIISSDAFTSCSNFCSAETSSLVPEGDGDAGAAESGARPPL